MEDHTQKLTDAELVSLALKSKDAYVSLVERYHDPLLRYIRRLGCTEYDDAQDILQNVFIKAYYNLNGYNAKLPFSSWIYRIAHNETISFFRKNNKKPISFENIDETILTALTESEHPEYAFDRNQNIERVRNALDRLDMKYREVLILYYLEGKTYQEISDILQKPMGTVSVLLNRAKTRLRKLITEQ